MSKKDLVNTVLEGIAKVKDYIQYIDNQTCLNENSSDEDTKKIVNKLFKLSKAVKDTFDEYYNNKQKELEEPKTDKSVPNNIVTNGIDSSVSSNNDEDVVQDGVEDIAQSSNENTDDQNVSNTIPTNEDTEPAVNPQDKTKTSEDPHPSEVETTVLEDSQVENTTLDDSQLDVATLEDSQVGNTNLERSEVETTTSKDPEVDTATIEGSEIETTTCEGLEVGTTSEKTSMKRVNEVDKNNLESDGDKSDSTAKDKPMDTSTDESVTPEETVVEKDDLPKDVDIKKEPPRIRLVDLNKLIDPNIRREVQFDNSVIILSSSDEENAPQPTNVKPKRREEKEKRKKENSKKSRDQISSKRKEKSSKISVDVDSESEIQISDSESDNSNRKSKRLKTVQNNKTKMRTEFKIKFGKRSAQANKKSKYTVDVSSDSSSSDSEKHVKLKTSRTGEHQSRLNDPKFNSKIYVPLPLYECEKMEEIYKENKESFVVLSSEKLKSLKISKRARTSPGGSSGSEPEKSKKKKQKTSANTDDEAESSKKIGNKTSAKDDVDSNDKSSKKHKKDKSDNECDEEDSSNNKNEKTKKTTTNGKDVESDGENTTKKSVKSSEDNNNSDNEKCNKKRNKKTESGDDDSKNEANTKNKKVRWTIGNDKDKKDECDEEVGQKEKGVDEEQPKKKTRAKKGSAENSGVESNDEDKESQKTTAILSISSGDDSDSPSISSRNDKKKKKTKNAVSDLPTESDAENNKDANEQSVKKDDSNSKDKSKKDVKSSSDDSDVGSTKKKVKKKSLETSDEDAKNMPVTIDSSDSDDDFAARSKKKAANDNSKKKRRKKVVSDSDDSSSDKKNKTQSSDSEGSDKSDNNKSDSSRKSNKSSSGESSKKQATRRRIRNAKDSSDSEEEVSTRKNIRKVLGKSSLSATTKQAEAEEKERKSRIAEKQKKYNRIFEEKKDATIDKVVLDYDEKTKEPALEVHKKIVKNLKPHQVSGIQFMYDACFESLERIKNSSGSGCILAHCMGLGKTLQVISLTHTLLTNSEKTKVEKVLVVCPINTVLNWKSEYKKWMPSSSEVDVYELATSKKNYERAYTVDTWHKDGGVLIIGYNLFRLLSNPTNKKLTKKMRTQFLEGLVDPGPDLVVCDEGHLLKNEKTNLSIAMNRIKTAKRIVLTGTPLQNNLKEYWCMVQFIKPNLLGTYKEYMNRFVNPIINGQYTDSTMHDTQLMRKRSHVLHKLLDGVVQRRDYSVLEPYLPPKHEYVLFVKLSDVQIKIYKCYMEKYARKNEGSNRTSFLFNDFQQLQRICTHPRVMLDKSSERKEKSDDEESEGSLKDFIDDDGTSEKSSSSDADTSSSDSDASDSGDRPKKSTRSRVTRAQRAAKRKDQDEGEDSDVIIEEKKEWFQEFCDGEELDNIKNSGKLSLLFEILKECEEIGDKVLVFSQSLYALNCIEYFLAKVDESSEQGSWSLGLDYFRLDGSSSCDNRAYWCDSFNNPGNTRARLFLISTKAGGLGINLVAANRVIIFDVSWNPSHDLQSIYRVYRFGQVKPCYIYRFVTYGAMEMKIYERQVTKQAISKRVIDEQQIDRHYNQNDLQELYKGDLEPTDRPLPMVPKDVLLGEMLQKYENIIFKYHLHQSLLENKEDEGLNEEERKAAWEEFENEKVLRKTTASSFMGHMMTGVAGIQGMSAQAINAALMNIVRRDNPTWSELQIKGIIPALVKQLQVQIEEQDMSMYQRVVQEINLMQQAKLKESMYQQQMMKLYQQQYLYQKQHQAVLGNMKFNPQQLQNLYGAQMNQLNQMNYFQGVNPYANGPSTSSNQRRRPQDVIELND